MYRGPADSSASLFAENKLIDRGTSQTLLSDSDTEFQKLATRKSYDVVDKTEESKEENSEINE